MKKKLTVLAIIFSMVFTTLAFTACSGGDSGSGDSGSGSGESAYGEGFVFKHGFDKDFPPYSYIDENGDTTGFDVELAQAVCEYYGWEYEAVPVNWDSKDAEIQSGSCDCIWSGFTKSASREENYLFSEPYSINTQMIMVREDSDIKTLEDLAGKKVGVQTATSAYDMLNAPVDEGGRADLTETFGSLEVFDTYTIAVTDLKAGAIDAVAIDVTTGDYQMGKVEGLRYLDEKMGDEVYAIGFRKDDTELCDLVNAALEALAENGKMDEIGKKYEEIYSNLSMINK